MAMCAAVLTHLSRSRPVWQHHTDLLSTTLLALSARAHTRPAQEAFGHCFRSSQVALQEICWLNLLSVREFEHGAFKPMHHRWQRQAWLMKGNFDSGFGKGCFGWFGVTRCGFRGWIYSSSIHWSAKCNHERNKRIDAWSHSCHIHSYRRTQCCLWAENRWTII